jgi:hypothetical protein
MVIELTDDEALVLFELLSDYGATDDGRMLAIRHVAERNALWRLEAALEKSLAAAFRPDYAEVLAAARARIEDQDGSWDP